MQSTTALHGADRKSSRPLLLTSKIKDAYAHYIGKNNFVPAKKRTPVL
jgi:hypothetical protein